MSNYRFLDFELSESDFCLSREGQRIALEPKALRVLTLLVSRAGRLVDKQELLGSVWPDTFVEENTLTRTIAILRRQLGDSSRDSKLIETVPTRGYRFIATVEIMPTPATVPSPASPGQPEKPAGLWEGRKRREWRRYGARYRFESDRRFSAREQGRNAGNWNSETEMAPACRRSGPGNNSRLLDQASPRAC